MSMKLSAEGCLVRVTLAGELTVADVKGMHEELLGHLTSETVVILSTGDVLRADAAVLQLMYALGRGAKALTVDIASEAWTQAWRQAGLDRVFERGSGSVGAGGEV